MVEVIAVQVVTVVRGSDSVKNDIIQFDSLVTLMDQVLITHSSPCNCPLLVRYRSEQYKTIRR